MHWTAIFGDNMTFIPLLHQEPGPQDGTDGLTHRRGPATQGPACNNVNCCPRQRWDLQLITTHYRAGS